MSQATIRTALAAVLAAAGAKNVSEEEAATFDMAEAVSSRRHGDRTHFWIVRAHRERGDGGAGYIHPRHRFTVEGYVGLARDQPTDGTVSDKTVADLWDDVVTAIETPTNYHPGNAIDFEGISIEPLRLTRVRVGTQRVPVHAMRATLTYLEA